MHFGIVAPAAREHARDWIAANTSVPATSGNAPPGGEGATRDRGWRLMRRPADRVVGRRYARRCPRASPGTHAYSRTTQTTFSFTLPNRESDRSAWIILPRRGQSTTSPASRKVGNREGSRESSQSGSTHVSLLEGSRRSVVGASAAAAPGGYRSAGAPAPACMKRVRPRVEAHGSIREEYPCAGWSRCCRLLPRVRLLEPRTRTSVILRPGPGGGLRRG